MSLAPDNLGTTNILIEFMKKKTLTTNLTLMQIFHALSCRTVFKCIDANNNVRCIKQIKLINVSSVIAIAHLEMIQREIYLLQHLAHPRIIRLYEYFCSNENNAVYIVMEYAAIGSLSKMIAHRHTQMDFLPEHVRKT